MGAQIEGSSLSLLSKLDYSRNKLIEVEGAGCDHDVLIEQIICNWKGYSCLTL